MNTRSSDITPAPQALAGLIAGVPCTAGWELTHRGGNFFEIRAPHPNGKDNWYVGVADFMAARDTAEQIFAAIVASSSCGCLRCQLRREVIQLEGER